MALLNSLFNTHASQERNVKTFFSVLFGLLVSSSLVWADNLSTVSKAIEKNYESAQKNQRVTLGEIAQKRAALKNRLAQLGKKIQISDALLKKQNKKIEELKAQRAAIQHEISSRLANKDELDSALVDHARNLLARAEKSPRSARDKKILPRLKKFSQKQYSFGMEDIKELIALYLNDMKGGQTQEHYSGQILDRNGEKITADIISFGHMFSIFRGPDSVGYGLFSPVSSQLIASASPSFWIRSNISDYFEGGKTLYTDISGGVAIAQLSQKTTLMDQIRSGGLLVIPIAIVGFVALMLIIERLIFLGRVRQNTDTLMTEVTALVKDGEYEKALEQTRPHKKRPTGHVLMAGLVHANQPRPILESCISEAILKQTPRLERFLNALKVLAAISTLLGLLGTVTGMINTFQVITIHGTGDPRLMAGGISEAMVTTQVGLAVAIPVMMMAAFLSGRARLIALDMEEKGLALMGALLQRNKECVTL